MARICIISPSLKMGGIERALSVLANYFVTRGHAVHFISCQKSEPFYVLDPRIRFSEFVYMRKSGALGKVLFYFNLIKFLRSTVSALKPDAVLSFGDAFNPLVLLALYGKKVPLYISDRTSPDFWFNPLVKLGKNWLYPRSWGFIAQTKRAADFNAKKFGNRLNIKVIPNAISPVAQKPEIERGKQILYIGRLSKEKGVSRLVSAFADVKHKDWKLVLAGDGPERTSLERQAADLNIGPRVKFLGKVKDIGTLLAQSSVFVLPSFVEGFPNALCEAMSAGLPSVCFDSIPHEELIQHAENGFVVPNGNIQKLADTLNLLINEPELRREVGTNALLINERLNIAKIGQEYLDFILKTDRI